MPPSWPWWNYETYPRVQCLRTADTINDDALLYDEGLSLKSERERLFTPRDDFSLDVVDFRHDGLSSEQPEYHTISSRGDFETRFDNPFEGYDTRFIILKPSDKLAVSSCPLHISEEIARKTFTTYQVMPTFLDCLHTFGEKHDNTDNHFAGAKHRLKYPSPGHAVNKSLAPALSGFELTYNFKFLYRTNNGSQIPTSNWRIRQTTVYHQHSYKEQRSVWILVQPSERVQNRLREHLKLQSASCLESCAKTPLETHLLFLSAAMNDWRYYFNALEAYFLEQTSAAVNKSVGTHDSTVTRRTIGANDPSKGLVVDFCSIQKLQKFEETVQDFKASLQVNVDVLQMLQHLNTSLKDLAVEKDRDTLFSWSYIDSVVREHIMAGQAQIRSSERLLQAIGGRRRLMYNVLDYQHKEKLNEQTGAQLKTIETLNNQTGEQLIANSNREEKRKLERAKTMKITKANMRETVGVRIMTVVALIYLPLTFTSSFLEAGIFSENNNRPPAARGLFSHIDFSLELLKLYLMMAFPLTFFTLAAWGLWEWMAWRKVQKVVDDKSAEDD